MPSYISTTQVPLKKLAPTHDIWPSEYFCLCCSFWNTASILSSTSILMAICIKTRYSFLFSTCNKYPPRTTNKWSINTLRQQGFPVFYNQTAEGDELGYTTDFLKQLSTLKYIYLGTMAKPVVLWMASSIYQIEWLPIVCRKNSWIPVFWINPGVIQLKKPTTSYTHNLDVHFIFTLMMLLLIYRQQMRPPIPVKI